jgi:DNA adenine methylase
MEVAARFINSELITGDFLSIVEHSREGDFVYFDPPYIPLTPTASFTSYSKLGFGLAEQERLAEAMRNLTNRGVKVMMSNSDTAVTRRIFSDFDLVTIEAPRVISSKSSTRGKVSEVVARNY